jgi:hypothetical protein
VTHEVGRVGVLVDEVPAWIDGAGEVRGWGASTPESMTAITTPGEPLVTPQAEGRFAA